MKNKWESVLFDCCQVDLRTKQESQPAKIKARQKGVWLYHEQTCVLIGGEIKQRNDLFTISHQSGLRLCEVKSKSRAIKLINQFHADGYGNANIEKVGVVPKWGNEETRDYFFDVVMSNLESTP